MWSFLQKRGNTVSIYKIGNTIRLVGYAVVNDDVAKWNSIISFTSISSVYKPKNNIGFIDLTGKYGFQVHKSGFIQNAVALVAGTYNFDVSWKI